MWARNDVRPALLQIVGEDSPALNATYRGGWRNFSIGMPTLVHLNDARRIFRTWAQIVRPTHELQDKQLHMWQADMLAWEIAVAHHGLAHTRLNSLMVSN